MDRVLIVGGSGMVGAQLQKKLIERGYSVSILGRSKSKVDINCFFKWNIETKTIDEEAITSADYIINLAGAGIAAKRWTNARKKEIISSRVDSTKFLVETIKKTNSKPKAFISASAIGYYGAITSDKIFNENDSQSEDFLGTCCQAWEDASKEIVELNVRRTIIRIGIVLSNNGGALTKMLPPFKFGFGSAIATGKQYMPWIHIDDLCEVFIKAIEDSKMEGIYNATSPNPPTNNGFSIALAKVLKKPYFLPNIPSFLIKTALGERAVIALKGNKVSAEKIKAKGFKHEYLKLEDALINLLK